MTSSAQRLKSRRGGTLVEFAFMSFLLVMLLLSTIEFERMVLVYTSLAHAARAGARFAAVNGNGGGSRTGIVPTSCGSAPPVQIANVVKNFASTGMMDTSKLTIRACYNPPASNAPGTIVTVKVAYPYDPFVGFWGQLRVNLASQTAGVITY